MSRHSPERNRIVHDDAREHLKNIQGDTVDHVITSPPYYDKRDYKVDGQLGREESVNEYIADLIDVFEQCLRVTKESGNIVFNIGDKRTNKSKLLIPYRFAIRVLDEWESVSLVNDITWLKSNPTPQRGCDDYLTDATEPFLHFT